MSQLFLNTAIIFIKSLKEKTSTGYILLLVIIIGFCSLFIFASDLNRNKSSIISNNACKTPDDADVVDSNHNNLSSTKPDTNPTLNNNKVIPEKRVTISRAPLEYNDDMENELLCKYANSTQLPSNSANIDNTSDTLQQLLQSQSVLTTKLTKMEDRMNEMHREILFMKKSSLIHTHHSMKQREMDGDGMHSICLPEDADEAQLSRLRRHSLTLEIQTPNTPASGSGGMYIWEKRKTASLNVSVDSSTTPKAARKGQLRYSAEMPIEPFTPASSLVINTPLSNRASHSNEVTPRW